LPVVEIKGYRPPPWLFNGHLQTIVPNQLRRLAGVEYQRQRLEIADGDFLDLDWSLVGGQGLAIIGHGLEGSSRRPYVMGLVRALNRRGWDALAWNMRGCGGQLNRLPRFYHSGASEDLESVVGHVLDRGDWSQVVLAGYSLGGNLMLKYLGERGADLDPRLTAAAAFSVPCDLKAGAEHMARWSNRAYLSRFLGSLKRKVRQKARLMPGIFDTEGLWRVRDFRAFDQRYTAPLHGFAGAEDYWRRNSSKSFIGAIRLPTLLLMAQNDPFLPSACYPLEEARGNPCVALELSRHGGHAGFSGGGDVYWSERRAVDFFEEVGGGI
jgi:uncharacterized protein